MRIRFSSRALRAGAGGLFAAAALALPLAGAGQVQAQGYDPESPRISLEFRVPEALVIYAEPDPAAAIVTQLAPYSVVNVMGRALGKDGQLWAHVFTPAFEELGWVPFAKLANASPTQFDRYGY